MRISLDYTKTIEQNVDQIYKKIKTLKKKIKGAELSVLEHERKSNKIMEVKAKTVKFQRDRQWYEKFRWFITTEGFIVIGGRDASTNEIIIKKHTKPNDIVLHSDIAGSPFCVIISENKEIGLDTIKEAAEFCAANSKAFDLGLSNIEVYYIKPEQVTKEAKSGEYLTKGAFMIYGRKSYLNVKLEISIGIDKDYRIMAGPLKAVQKHCISFINIIPGKSKKSDIAKKIKHLFENRLYEGQKINLDLDEIIRVMPSGSCEIK